MAGRVAAPGTVHAIPWRAADVRARGTRTLTSSINSLERPLGVEAHFVEVTIVRSRATEGVRTVGIAAADRIGTVIDPLVLVDEREVDRLERLVGHADIEVIVLQIRRNILAQLRMVIAAKHRER